MIVSLTRQLMLEAWRKRAGLEPSAAACSVERFDCVDIDSLIESHMRAWYLDMLDRGCADLVGPPTADVTDLLSISVSPCGYEGVIALDPSLRRLDTLRLDDWLFDTKVIDGNDIKVTIAHQPNRFARAGTIAPLVWHSTAGIVRAIPAHKGSQIVAASGFVDPGPETYIIDERALTLIPDIFKTLFLTNIGAQALNSYRHDKR